MDRRSRICRVLAAHIGWLLEAQSPDIARTVPDLIRDRITMLGISITRCGSLPAGAAGVDRSRLAGAHGALDGLLWGGFVRIS